MSKSAQAFRTIREVADWLGVAAHVLRFWESKFHQIKPVKRAGGRRYYRPADMELVGGIKVLLHDRGLTIRGVQKMISDEGIDAIAALSPPINDLAGDGDVIELAPGDAWDADVEAEATTPPDSPESTEMPAEPEAAAPIEDSTTDDGPAEKGFVPEPQTASEEPAHGAGLPPVDKATPDVSERDAEQETREAGPAALAPADGQSGVAVTQDQPKPKDSPAVPIAASPAALPVSDPMEGPLGTLAALAKLPPDARSVHAAQIAALARLQARMSTHPDQL